MNDPLEEIVDTHGVYELSERLDSISQGYLTSALFLLKFSSRRKRVIASRSDVARSQEIRASVPAMMRRKGTTSVLRSMHSHTSVTKSEAWRRLSFARTSA